MLDAVVFDFDGVIVDTEPLHWRAFQRVLEPLGFSFSWEEYLAGYVGLDDRGAFRTAFGSVGKPLDDACLSELISRKAGIFQEEISGGVVAYPGVLDLIAEVAEARPVALCSGALRSDIEPVIDRLGVARYFPVVVSADDVHASKPDPESYRMALQRLSAHYPGHRLRPEACLAIEDTPAGIASAKGAGLSVLAVTNNFPAQRLGTANWITQSLEGVALSRLEQMISSPEATAREES